LTWYIKFSHKKVYGCEIGQYKGRMQIDSVRVQALRRIFGYKKQEVIGGQRK
jgi:hypothetical protein